MPRFRRALCWFRRDLRTQDHAALYHALKSCQQVFCAFVFDRNILNGLPKSDRRVAFIRESLTDLNAQLTQLGLPYLDLPAGLLVRHDTAKNALPDLAARLSVDAVFINHDDEPDSLARDAEVLTTLLDCAHRHGLAEVSPMVCDLDEPDRLAFPLRRGLAWRRRVDELRTRDAPDSDLLPGYASLFNGALFRAETIEAVGVPDLRLFIRGDEYDVHRRLVRSGLR